MVRSLNPALLQAPVELPRSVRERVETLREFDGRHARTAVAGSAVTLLALSAIPFITAVATAYAAVGGKAVSAVIGVLATGGFSFVAGKVRQRVHWQAPIDRRLALYEAPNNATELQVLVRRDDAGAAHTALRRAKFNPGRFGLLLVVPPADALDLNCKFGVQEPAAWMQSSDDDERIERVADVLAKASITARVHGTDVLRDTAPAPIPHGE